MLVGSTAGFSLTAVNPCFCFCCTTLCDTILTIWKEIGALAGLRRDLMRSGSRFLICLATAQASACCSDAGLH